jgi:O-antigen ligase
MSWRIAALAGGCILILAIMVTYSRQAYLIGLLGIFLLLLRRNAVLTVLAVGLLAVSAITALTTILPESVTERVMQTQQASATGTAKLDTSTSSRFYIWEGAVRMWQDNPAGVGLNRFREYIGRYTNRAGVDAHNSFVLILAECGPLGLLALLWLLWRLWELAGRMRLSAAGMDGEATALALGFTLMVVSMALGNSFSSFLFDGSVMANFWIMCGLLERYAALREHGMLASEEHAPAPASIFDRFPLASRIQPGHRPPG